MKNAFLVLISIFITTGLFAQVSKYGIKEATAPKGLLVGEIAPNIVSETISEKPFELRNALQSKPVVILFFRGSWCPVCVRYLNNLSDSISMLNNKAQVYAISLEKDVFIKELQKEVASDIFFLKDTDGQIAKQYKVMFDVTEAYKEMFKGYVKTNLADRNANEKAQLVVPATFVINTSGKIIYRQFDYNYSSRASVADILENL